MNKSHPVKASSSAVVATIAWQGSDTELLRRLQESTSAAALLYDRFAEDVNRTVRRTLGPDQEHDDVVHEVFIQLLRSVHRVREAEKLRGWVISVAINTVRGVLRKRTIFRRFHVGKEPPEMSSAAEDHAGRDLLRRTFAVLNRLPVELRLAFTLRYLESHTLPKVAEHLGCSLATAKRRLKKAEQRFTALVSDDPALYELMAEGGRFGGGQ
ncbi:MAG: sigma-70 family RNA polymerase sigma factor [Deltaproteobacteria bacterium]|nr:sigma-70 family RNA polymerase sigma factor [Deltaproteobacteria bacterium]